MKKLYVVKVVTNGLIGQVDLKLKQLEGKWGFFGINNQIIPLSVWPEQGKPTDEWIADCENYYFGDEDEEERFAGIRERSKDLNKNCWWLASNHEGVDNIGTEKLT
jgi:hypothetical protein